MATKSQAQIRHLKSQLATLEEQKETILGLINGYAMNVINEVTCWIERPGDNVRSFKDVCTLVSSATSALVDNQELYSEVNSESTASNTEWSTLAATSSFVSSSAESRPNNYEHLTKIIPRLETLEEAVASLRRASQTSLQEQEHLKEQLNNLSTQQETAELNFETMTKKQSRQYKTLKNQLLEQEKVVMAMKEETILQNEKQMKINAQFETVSQELNKNKSEVNKQLETLARNIKDLTQETSKTIHSLQEENLSLTGEIKQLNKKNEMTCKMLIQWIGPIEKLKETFNKTIAQRETNNEKLNSLTKEYSNMAAKIKTSEKNHSCSTGFTAYPSLLNDDGSSPIIQCPVVGYNSGHYDPNTSIFTAPVDGLYLASFVLYQAGSGALNVHMMRQFNNEEKCVGILRTTKDYACASNISVLPMKTGEKLFVKLYNRTDFAIILDYTHFSCFLISQ
ncbi:ankyrin repeat domain-containing protein 26-like isoform X2 [Physella acuta]|nr:ankyrin repeat domain-containing protein 26-like isoform X2 [Physella acuta]XP_059139241.1 ankyrin repeat domain-containing protein 26-like isoform X2 [Physella acuta]